MAESVQTAIYQLQMDSSQFKADASAVQAVTAKISGEFERLEGKLDRNIALEMRRSNAIEQVNRVAREEGIEDSRRAAAIDMVNAKYDQQIAKLNQVNQVAANSNRVIAGAGSTYTQFGSRVQNSAFQVADFFVQVQSGTPIMRAATQQGSQFLAAFGPWGAVIGAAAAILGTMATSMGLFDTNTKDATASQEAFNKTIADAARLMDQLNGKLDRSRASMEAERRNLLELAQTRLTNAERDLSQTQQFVSVGRGGAVQNPEFLKQQEAIKQMRLDFRILQGQLGQFDDGFKLFGTTSKAATETATKGVEGTIAAHDKLATRLEREQELNKELAEEEKERLTRIRQLYDQAAAAQNRREIRAAQAANQLAQQEEHLRDVLTDQVSMLTNAALGFEDWRDVAKQAINVVIQELSKLNSLGGSGGGIFDLLFKIGGAALGGAAGGIGGGSVVGGPGFGTARAEGGPVEAGRVYTVGERGPETFVPRTSGRIVPNSGGGSTVIYQSFDFRNAVVDTAKIQAQIARASPRQIAASEANISDKRKRGALPAFR